MAAAVFETPDEAKTKMELSGIKYWELGEAPAPYRESGQLFKAAHTTEDPSKTRPTFTPSDKTGFKIGSTMSL